MRNTVPHKHQIVLALKKMVEEPGTHHPNHVIKFIILSDVMCPWYDIMRRALCLYDILSERV